VAKISFPIRSMTGFARASASFEGVEVTVEARSVNHRFLEIALKAPRGYSVFEREVKGAVQHLVRRGRIDLFISRERVSAAPSEARAATAAQEGIDAAVQVYLATCRRYGASPSASGEGLATFIGQLLLRQSGSTEESSEISENEEKEVVALVRAAAEKLVEMRQLEGAALAQDILLRLTTIGKHREEIVARGLHAPARLRERLSEKLAAIAPDLSAVQPDRLAQEVALLAERVDISEELSRLEIHLNQFATLIKDGHADGVGRKLDFMTQEIGRELNTIGSKAQDAAVQQIVVEAKAELERIREQVQNIE
jgi:uncharacterized protein (TIGR00255 family)